MTGSRTTAARTTAATAAGATTGRRRLRLLSLAAAGVAALGITAAATAGGVTDAESELPESWQGTVSTQRLAAAGGGEYLALINLYGQDGPVGAQDLEDSEFFAGAEAQCAGVAELDGDPARCTFQEVDERGERTGVQRSASVRLVEGTFDSTALLVQVGQDEAPDLPAPAATPLGLGIVSAAETAQVSQDELEDAALSAVMMGASSNGIPSEELGADCEIREAGESALCEITGTPGGEGDGTYLATAQPGPDAAGTPRTAYLLSRLA